MHNPTNVYPIIVKHILRYLKGTLNDSLMFSTRSLELNAYNIGIFDLNAYYDADYAGNPDDRQLFGGFCIFLRSNLISWCVKKQAIVSTSSTKAKYRSLSSTSRELCWLSSLFKELNIPIFNVPTIFYN
jgi:hypothetical protein